MVRNHVGEPVISLTSCSSVAEQRLDKAQVDGSFPSARTRFPPCGAAGSARDSGSRGRRFDPCRGDQTSALGCGRSSTAEPWAVNPLVPVRLRPVTPKRISSTGVANSSGREPGSYPGWSGFEPLATHQHPPWRNPADAPVSETGAARHCPFDSDRGDHSPVR